MSDFGANIFDDEQKPPRPRRRAMPPPAAAPEPAATHESPAESDRANPDDAAAAPVEPPNTDVVEARPADEPRQRRPRRRGRGRQEEPPAEPQPEPPSAGDVDAPAAAFAPPIVEEKAQQPRERPFREPREPERHDHDHDRRDRHGRDHREPERRERSHREPEQRHPSEHRQPDPRQPGHRQSEHRQSERREPERRQSEHRQPERREPRPRRATVAMLVDIDELAREARDLGGELAMQRLRQGLANGRTVTKAIAIVEHRRPTPAGFQTVLVDDSRTGGVELSAAAVDLATTADSVILAPPTAAMQRLATALGNAGHNVELAGFAEPNERDDRIRQDRIRRLGRDCLFIP